MANLLLLVSIGLINCQDVGVGLDLFFTFSNGDSSDVCNSLFSRGYWHHLCFNQRQLLITLLDLFSLSSGYALHLVVWKLYFYYVFCLPTAVHFNNQVYISCFFFFCFVLFFTFIGVALVGNSFSLKELENLTRQTFSKDSMTMKSN